MKTRQIIQLVISLAGLGWFAYYLLGIWWGVGYNPWLLIGTLAGLPVGGILYWLIRQRDRKVAAQAQAGKDTSRPMVWTFVFIGFIVFLVPLFNMLSEVIFLTWASSALAGGFGWWFIVVWGKMMKKTVPDKK